MRDGAIKSRRMGCARLKVPCARDEVDRQVAASLVGVNVTRQIIKMVLNTVLVVATRSRSADRLSTFIGLKMCHTIYSALRIANEQMARIMTGHSGIHGERIKRIDQRSDLLTQAHVETQHPRQRHIAQYAQYAEATSA